MGAEGDGVEVFFGGFEDDAAVAEFSVFEEGEGVSGEWVGGFAFVRGALLTLPISARSVVLSCTVGRHCVKPCNWSWGSTCQDSWVSVILPNIRQKDTIATIPSMVHTATRAQRRMALTSLKTPPSMHTTPRKKLAQCSSMLRTNRRHLTVSIYRMLVLMVLTYARCPDGILRCSHGGREYGCWALRV